MKIKIKSALRDLVVAALMRTRYAGRGALLEAGLVVLTFHRVLPEALRREYPLRQLVVTPEELDWIIGTLQEHFVVDTLSQSVLGQAAGPAGKPRLAITFDDGQWDNLAYAAPVLDARRVRASFYIPTSYIGSSGVLWHDEVGFRWRQQRAAVLQLLQAAGHALPAGSLGQLLESLKVLPSASRAALLDELRTVECNLPAWGRLMDWQEVASLRAAGHEIGSHACRHDLLPTLGVEGQREEIAMSRAVIQQRLGFAPGSFCYPNGSYDADSLRLVREAGYTNAITTEPGVVRAGDDVLRLRRHDMNADRLRDSTGKLSADLLWFRLLRAG